MNAQGASRIVSRIVGAVVGAVALVFALLFSVALFAALAVAGLGVFGYVWWKTRALRRRMRDELAARGQPDRERDGLYRERDGSHRERDGSHRERRGRIIESTEIYEVRDARLEDRSNTTRRG